MIYEIESKTDISGVTLLVRFPEKDLDSKALYTIQAENPAFLVPFRYRSVDGQVECTYILSDLSKLQYRFGTRSPAEYVDFWEKILQPLLDCGDWFLKPLSFALDPSLLFTDREEKDICYLYIPSKRDCASFDELRKMVAELSRRNSVTDTGLENKVLRAIMQDFQPKAFLQMLRESRPKPAVIKGTVPAVVQIPETPASEDSPELSDIRLKAPVSQGVPVKTSEDDIVIDLSGRGAKEPENTGKKSLFGHKSEKKKPEKAAKKGGLFGGKKDKKSKEIVLGAAAEGISQAAQPKQAPVSAAPVWHPPVEESEVTQLDEDPVGVCLRLVGDPSLPREIPVNLAPGAAFTIGRFDVSVGHKQSDFEFDKRTKAVSRHHAVIERQSDGSYTVMDLSSAAGTFVDGIRALPNVPQRLERGSRIAFGTGGADYVWEE